MKYLVINASPIILLGKIGKLELLALSGRKSITPGRVVKEVMQKHSPEALALEYALNNWLEAFDDVSNALTISSIIGEDVKRGEVDVIAKAYQLLDEKHDVIAVLDDRTARHGAHALSIPITGTLGIVFNAVRIGKITPEVGIRTVNELISVGARLDAILVREMIDKINSF
ncbi:MAG: hypothetical protein KAR76_01715 [Methanosarcinales archaeon]|nr:hypothetical protein [Methanosarcinales archaeon]